MYFNALKSAESMMDHLDEKISEVSSQPSIITFADGKEMYRISSENRHYLPLKQIPKRVRDAMLAAEDKRFYEHRGVDLVGVARVVFLAAKEGRASQGG